MKTLINKMGMSLLGAKMAAKRFVSEERGDTNFISIAIILVIVIVIAILFITLGQDMADKLGTKIQELMDALG